jgi:uncharacterized membrane protein
MSATALPKDVRSYLRRLDAASRGLPRTERRELRAQIEEHLRAGLAAEPTQAEVLTLLDRLGDPEEIVAEQYGPRRQATQTAGAQEWITVLFLLFGAALFLVGWLVGVVMLWSSRAWSIGEKLLGTLILPGGIVGAFFAVSVLFVRAGGGGECTSGGGLLHAVHHCTGGTSTIDTILAIALVALIVIAPIATGVMLIRRARPALA